MSRILCFTVGLCGLLALVARPAHPSQEDLAQRFRVLATSRTGTLQTELNQAAAASYQFRAAWSCACGWDSLFVLVEKSTDPSVAREFRVLGAHKTATLRRELYEAGREGFRLLPGGMFRKVGSSTSEGLEVVMLLERLPDASQQYDYLLVDPPTRAALLEDGVDLLEDRGYRVEGLVHRNSHHVLVGVKPTDGGLDSNQATPRVSYRLVAAAQQVLDQAAGDGYRLVKGFNPWDLVMEQTSEPGRPYKYLVLPGVDTETLQFDMNAAGARGFQLHPRTIFGLNVIMELSPGARTQYEYTFLETVRAGSLQRELIEASAEGHTVIGVTWGGGRHLGFLEKSAGPLAVSEIPSSPADALPWLRRSADSPSVRENVFLAAYHASTLQDELNEAAGRGFRFVNGSFSRRPSRWNILTERLLGAGGVELTAVMEKISDSAVYEYLVVSTLRKSTEAREIEEAAQRGYEVVARLRTLVKIKVPSSSSSLVYCSRAAKRGPGSHRGREIRRRLADAGRAESPGVGGDRVEGHRLWG